MPSRIGVGREGGCKLWSFGFITTVIRTTIIAILIMMMGFNTITISMILMVTGCYSSDYWWIIDITVISSIIIG